jgi:hypothetical protein
MSTPSALLVEIAGTWIDASEVVAVTSEGQISVVHFGGGSRVSVPLAAARVAQLVNHARGQNPFGFVSS